MMTVPRLTAIDERLRGPARSTWLCVLEARPIVLSIFALRFLVAVALTEPGDAAPVEPGRLALGLATWLLGTGSVYLFDGTADVVEDRLNGSRRPIASGALSRTFAVKVALAWGALSVTGGAILGPVFLVPVILALLLGYAYSGPTIRLKRWSLATGAIVLMGGMLTFVAGASLAGTFNGGHSWMVFAAAMSLWMAVVGSVAKDFPDVRGDAIAGRRTVAVVKGATRTGHRLSANALAVAFTFLGTALLVDRRLVWPALVVLPGAVTIGVCCWSGLARARPRAPYRVFMMTQYLAHAAVLVALAS